MAKITSKLQVTIPKALAEQYGIRPGDEVEFQPAGAVIRLVPSRARRPPLDTAERLRLFDEATARQKEREARMNLPYPAPETQDRGWSREELYQRGSSD